MKLVNVRGRTCVNPTTHGVSGHSEKDPLECVYIKLYRNKINRFDKYKKTPSDEERVCFSKFGSPTSKMLSDKKMFFV